MPDPNQSDPNSPQPVVPTVDPIVPAVLPIDPTANGSAVSSSTEAPVVFPTDDVAPMPDFMNQGSPDSPVPPISPILDSSSQIPASDGSAAPVDFPNMASVTTPKKKFGGGKLIATILGILVLVGGIGTGVYLTQQQQQLNSEAKKGQKSAYDIQQEKKEIAKLEKKSEEAAQVVIDKPNSQAAAQKLAEAKATVEVAKKAAGGEPLPATSGSECTAQGGDWCAASSGGFCIVKGSQTCDAAITIRTGEMPTRGGNYISKPAGGCTGTYYYECNCADAKLCFDRGTYGGADQCTNPGGLCDVAKTTAPVTGGAAAGTTNTYYCSGEFIGEAGGGQSCTTPLKAGFNINCYCGTIQTDTIGGGFKSQSMKCGCGGGGGGSETTTTSTTSLTTSDSAVCQNVKAYSSTWVALTSAQLSALAPATVINFCVVGSATAGIFDRAQFTINGVIQAETTTQRPSTQDYCQNYTIPAGVSAFNVTAKIHHATLGWK